MATEPLWGIMKPFAGQKDWARVEAVYKQIIKLDPRNSVAHYWLGVLYFNRKDYASAKSCLNVCLDLNPFDYNVLLTSAWTNYYLGNLSEAKVLFQKNLLNHPGDASASEGLALIK